MNSKLLNFSLTNTLEIDFVSSMKRLKISHISEVIIKTISDLRNMTYQHFLNNPMPIIGRKLNTIIAKDPPLKKPFNRNRNHPIIRNCSHFSNK